MSDSQNISLQVKISNKQILSIALPIAASILVPQLNFVINNIFLGHVSKDSLAIAGITGVYYLIFAVIGNGLNNGLQSLISRRAGENKPNEIGKLFNHGIRISLILSFIGIAITWLIAPKILQYCLHNENNTTIAINFLNIRILGLPFLYVYQMRNALLVGTNRTKYLIIGTAIEALSNVLFDYILLFGKFGAPKMGFNGAAVASIIAEIMGLIVIFIVLHVKGINQEFKLLKKYRFDGKTSKLILIQSAPLIAQYAISIISWEFFYILIEHQGNTSLAVSNAMRNIFGLFGCFTWAFASTSNAMVSNIIGQGLHDKVIELVYKIMKLNIIGALLLCVFLNVFPNLFLSVYGQGTEFIAAAIPVLRVVSAALMLMSASVVWLNAVTGTGNTKINLYIEIMAIILYCCYVYMVLEHWHLNIVYGWASEWLYWTSMLIPSFIYIQSNKWKNKKL